MAKYINDTCVKFHFTFQLINYVNCPSNKSSYDSLRQWANIVEPIYESAYPRPNTKATVVSISPAKQPPAAGVEARLSAGNRGDPRSRNHDEADSCAVTTARCSL